MRPSAEGFFIGMKSMESLEWRLRCCHHSNFMHPMLNIAVKAARRAGSIISRASENLDVLTIKHKSLNDLVSEVDRTAEDAIIDVIKSAYPEHAILAEESGLPVNQNTSGSSTRSTAPPIFCMAFRNTAYPSA